MKKNIVVIFGGKSTEHDISILTACQVMSALNKNFYNLMPIYITNGGKWFSGEKLSDVNTFANFKEKSLFEVAILPHDNFLYKKSLRGYKRFTKLDCAIICCHGKNGEDGTIQGLLELSGVPYTSSGVLGSGVGLDKVAMKQFFVSEHIPVCKFFSLSKKDYQVGGVDYVLKNIPLPVIVKPNNLGSSIGISVAKTIEQLEQAIEMAFIFDNQVIIEEFLSDIKEVNISVLGDEDDCECSLTEEPKKQQDFLTFADKYIDDNSGGKKTEQPSKVLNVNNTSKTSLNGMQNLSRIVPANITKKQVNKINKLAEKIFKMLHCKGVVRIDFMVDNKTQKIYVNEINTIPGSLAFYLWEMSGLSFDKLVDKLIEIAENVSLKNSRLTTTFDTSILSKKTHTK